MDGRLADAVLGLDGEPSVTEQQQDAAPRAGILDQDAHQRVEQALEDDLAGDGLGSLEHRADVERGAGGRGSLRAPRAAEDLAGNEVGVRALEAPHRLRRAPLAVDPVGLGQVGAGDRGLAERAEREARELVGERLVVEVATAQRQGDRLVVVIAGSARVAAGALELGQEEGAAVREVLRAEVRPARELFGDDLRVGEEERALVRGDHVRCLRERDAGIEMERRVALPGRHAGDLGVQRERGARRFLERTLEDAEEHDVEVGEEEEVWLSIRRDSSITSSMSIHAPSSVAGRAVSTESWCASCPTAPIIQVMALNLSSLRIGW